MATHGKKDKNNHEKMNKDTMHLDDTVPVTAEQRNALEVAIAETKEKDKNKDQENALESLKNICKANITQLLKCSSSDGFNDQDEQLEHI